MRRILALFAALALLLVVFTPPPPAPSHVVLTDAVPNACDFSSPADSLELEEEDWGVPLHSMPAVAYGVLQVVSDREGRGADSFERRLEDPPRS